MILDHQTQTCHLIPGRGVSPPSNSTSTWIAIGRHLWCSPFQSPNLKSKGRENWTQQKTLHYIAGSDIPENQAVHMVGWYTLSVYPNTGRDLIPLWWVAWDLDPPFRNVAVFCRFFELNRRGESCWVMMKGVLYDATLVGIVQPFCLWT